MGNFLISLSCLCLVSAPVYAEHDQHVGGEDEAPGPDHHQNLAHEVAGVPLNIIIVLHNSCAILGQILKITSTADCLCSVLSLAQSRRKSCRASHSRALAVLQRQENEAQRSLIFVSIKVENTMKTTKWWLSAVTGEKMFDRITG